MISNINSIFNMKRNIYGLAALLLAGIALPACEDLDTAPEGSTITSEQKDAVYTNNPERSLSAITSIFSQMTAYMPNYDAISREAHSDFGYPSIMAFNDRLGEDMVTIYTGYNWFSNSLTYTNHVYGQYNSTIIWNDLYSYIFSSNNVISAFNVSSESTDAELDALSTDYKFSVAQAFAMRAFSYFNLVQLYAFNVVGHGSDLAVPIITEQNAEEVAVEGALLSTVDDVYALIYADLKKAIYLLEQAEDDGYARPDKRYIDLATAYGIRARVNLVAQKYEDAAADANAAIEITDAEPASIDDVSKPYFSSLDEGNWLWGIKIAETDDVVNSGIVNYPSHCYTLNYGYANYSGASQISKKLFNSISETDVRRGWWIDEDGVSANLNAEQQGFMTDYGYAPYTVCKFAPYKNVVGTATSANDIPLLRVEELYLIKAEAENSVAVLNDFVKTYRDPEYNFTGDDLKKEIWRQRRIEFWGEGLNWFDVMRFGQGFDRRGAGFASNYVYVVSGTDGILLWPVPESEVEANKALKNAGYTYTYSRPKSVPDLDIEL